MNNKGVNFVIKKRKTAETVVNDCMLKKTEFSKFLYFLLRDIECAIKRTCYFLLHIILYAHIRTHTQNYFIRFHSF